jgi:hypothetical protein
LLLNWSEYQEFFFSSATAAEGSLRSKLLNEVNRAFCIPEKVMQTFLRLLSKGIPISCTQKPDVGREGESFILLKRRFPGELIALRPIQMFIKPSKDTLTHISKIGLRPGTGPMALTTIPAQFYPLPKATQSAKRFPRLSGHSYIFTAMHK